MTQNKSKKYKQTKRQGAGHKILLQSLFLGIFKTPKRNK